MANNEGTTTYFHGGRTAGSTGSPRAGPAASSRGSSSSVAGTRAGLREGSSGRDEGTSVRTGDAAQASAGSRAAAGVAAGSAKGTGAWQPSMSGAASWFPLQQTPRDLVYTGVESGASSASWASDQVKRDEITHMPAFPCASQRRNTTRALQRRHSEGQTTKWVV